MVLPSMSSCLLSHEDDRRNGYRRVPLPSPQFRSLQNHYHFSTVVPLFHLSTIILPVRPTDESSFRLVFMITLYSGTRSLISQFSGLHYSYSYSFRTLRNPPVFIIIPDFNRVLLLVPVPHPVSSPFRYCNSLPGRSGSFR